MKALKTALVVFVTGILLSLGSQAKAEGENTTAIIKPWVVVNSDNTVTVFWNQIENVQQYRVCINRECPAKWNEYKPSKNSATFPLGSNETKLFWVHAWLTDNAENYNTSGTNNEKWADSFKWLTASNLPSATTTTTVPVITTVPVSFGGYGSYTPITIPPISWTPSTWSPTALPPISWNTYGTTTRIRPAAYPVIKPATRVPSIAVPSAGKCVGVCWGVPSKVNGLPRNSYVSGYFRANGTWVNPYTRSNP
jgi:hypothetical protein